MSLIRAFRVYIIPGAIFQSILVGGGYGTGREVVEYFTDNGPIGGLLAMTVAFCVFAIVLGLTFEIARRFRAYDYRSFFRVLLGPFWFLYEGVGVFMLMLTFAVLIAAASGVLVDGFGWPAWIGILLVFFLVGVLEFFGRDFVMAVLTFWSLVLYAVFIGFLFKVYGVISDDIGAAFATGGIEPGWAQSGFLYAMYNMTAAPIILYVARDFERPREAVGAGVIGALIAVLPAAIFHVAFAGVYPQVGEQDIPVYWMMNMLGLSILPVVYTIMLYGTLIETGAGVLQGVNERIDNWRLERDKAPLGKWGHSAVALAFMGTSLGIASIGIIAIIAKGYSTMGLIYLAIYFLPLMTVGVWKIARRPALTD